MVYEFKEFLKFLAGIRLLFETRQKIENSWFWFVKIQVVNLSVGPKNKSQQSATKSEVKVLSFRRNELFSILRRKKSLWANPKTFHHTQSQCGTFKTILSHGDQEMTTSRNRHFHFKLKHKHKTVKKCTSVAINKQVMS